MRSTLLAGMLCGLVLALLPHPASAETTAEQGTPLPWRYETSLGYIQLADRSPEYLMHHRTQYDEDRGRTYTVVRVSDGQVVTTFERPWSMPGPQAPRLVDQAYVEMVPRPNDSMRPDRLEIRDLATGVLTTIDLSVHGMLVHGDDEWALVSDAGATPGSVRLSFVHADGTTVPVSGLDAGSDVTWVGGDSETAYVNTGSRSYVIEPGSGEVATVTEPDGSSIPLWSVTHEHLVGRSYTTVEGRAGYRFTVLDRATGGLRWRTTVAHDYHNDLYLPYGDGVAVLYRPDGGTLYRSDLRPVDMSTGALLPAVATDVASAGPMGNGQVGLVLADVAPGRLAVAPGTPSTVQPVRELPRIGYGSLDVGLSGGRVVTSLSGQPGLWSTAPDGTGAWEPTYPASDPEDDRQGDFALGGDVVLTQVSRGNYSVAPSYRLAWPGGSRDLSSRGRPVLGRDGAHVVRYVPHTSPALVEVQEVRTGVVVASWTGPSGHLLDGSWLWTGPEADGSLRGVDLRGQEPDRTAVLALDCVGRAATVREIRGRWALTLCSDHAVVDLWGVLRPWTVPASTGEVTLGNDFVAWVGAGTAPTGRRVFSLAVADLTAEHTTRSYGPMRGQVYPPGLDFAVDVGQGAAAVYVDTSSRVRHVDLAWLGRPPLSRPDETPPVVTREPSLAPAVRTTVPVTVAPSWTYEDPDVPHEPPSGLQTFDIRMRAYPAAPTTAWEEPATWTGLAAPEVAVELQPGEGRCFQSRATDRAGNLTAWSQSACSFADGTAPALDRADGSPRLVPGVTGRVAYRFGARDDHAVSTYDVAVRTAARGRNLGPWRTGWPATTRTSVTVDGGPGTERCFRFRARDVAGNVSVWSRARCSALPVDDSQLTTRGPHGEGSLDIAILGTVTELQARGSSVTLPRQAGRSVAVWAIKGPYQGSIDVYAGGRHLGRAGLGARWQRRGVVVLRSRRPWTGPVRVVATSGRAVRVDAIAVLR